MTLPAFAAERRLQHGASQRACSYRSIYPARRTISIKPAARRCYCRSIIIIIIILFAQ